MNKESNSDIEDLINGYQQFRKNYFSGNDNTFAELVRDGQKPKTLVIACSDSRVDPALVMNCRPGDLFVIRNVANLVPPHEQDNSYHGTSAALQFAICGLKIRNVILFGHSQCGGIEALLENYHVKNPSQNFIDKWIELALPAREITISKHADLTFREQVDKCSQYALMNSLKNLLSFPWISDKVSSEELNLHAWYFDLTKGEILSFDANNKCFTELLQPEKCKK